MRNRIVFATQDIAFRRPIVLHGIRGAGIRSALHDIIKWHSHRLLGRNYSQCES